MTQIFYAIFALCVKNRKKIKSKYLKKKMIGNFFFPLKKIWNNFESYDQFIKLMTGEVIFQ